MRPSSRDQIIEAALRASASSGRSDVTLDAVGRAAGVTKQGVMYHFPNKAALRRAMLERILSDWEREMSKELGNDLTEATPGARVAAYARVAARGHVVQGEPALFAELLRHVQEFDRYAEWAESWFLFGVPDEERGRILAAWLAANGLWSALTAKKLTLTSDDVEAVVKVISGLVE